MTTKNPTPAAPVAIKKVVVQLGKKELVIDIEDAKQLRDALNTLFGGPAVKETVIREEHHHYPKPYYWDYSKPYWGGGLWAYTNKDNIVYCANTTTGNSGITSTVNAANFLSTDNKDDGAEGGSPAEVK